MAAQGQVVEPKPQEAHVLLEPKNRAEIDALRSALIVEAERELPDAIASPQEYAAVGDLEARLTAYVTRWEPVFDDHVAGAHKVWKTACGIRDFFVGVPAAWKAKCRKLRGAYEQKELEARRAEERRLAEEQRQADIRRRNEEAKLLERQGQKDMAVAVRQQPVHAQSVSLPSAIPDVAGVASTRSNWTWRIAGCTGPDGGRKDKAARKRAAALVPRQYLDLDDASLTALRTMRGTVKVPGIEFYEEKV